MPPKGRQGAAKKVRRKEKKNVAHGHAHIKSTFNNTIVSITDVTGNVISNDTKSGPASSRCFRNAAKASTGLRREQESSISRRRSRAAAAKREPNRLPEQRDKSRQARER